MTATTENESSDDAFASPVHVRYLGILLVSAPPVSGMNPAGRSSSMWMESERVPYHKYTSSFAWTDKPAARLPGGYKEA